MKRSFGFMGFLNDNDKELMAFLFERHTNYLLDKLEKSVKTASTESRFSTFLYYLDTIREDPTLLGIMGGNHEKHLEKILRDISGFTCFNIRDIPKYEMYAAKIKVSLNMISAVEINKLKPYTVFFYRNEKYIKIKPVLTKVGLCNAISYDYAECVWIDPATVVIPIEKGDT